MATYKELVDQVDEYYRLETDFYRHSSNLSINEKYQLEKNLKYMKTKYAFFVPPSRSFDHLKFSKTVRLDETQFTVTRTTRMYCGDYMEGYIDTYGQYGRKCFIAICLNSMFHQTLINQIRNARKGDRFAVSGNVGIFIGSGYDNDLECVFYIKEDFSLSLRKL